MDREHYLLEIGGTNRQFKRELIGERKTDMIKIDDQTSLKDAREFFRIESQCIENGFTMEMIEGAIEKSLSRFIKALKDKKIIGYINYSIIIDEAELNSIAVLEPYRKNGVASALMKKMLEDCKRNEIRAIFLEVNENNIEAIEFYQKLGFCLISKRKNYYKDADALIYKYSIFY